MLKEAQEIPLSKNSLDDLFFCNNDESVFLTECET